jgi:hypothetical protein
MQSIIEKYLSVNPRRLNPFNRPNHDFVPSGDDAADADYLDGVAAGAIDRFYVTLCEQVNRAGHYRVIIVDGFNNNTLASAPVSLTKPYKTADDALFAAVDVAIASAARHGLAFRPELTVAHSIRGLEHADRLTQYAEGVEPVAVEMAVR